MGLPPQKNIRLPVKNMGLPLKNMGLPLKNFIASQLGRGGGEGCGYYMHYPIWNGPLPSRPLSSTRPFLGRQATALPAFCCGEERCMRTQKTAGFALETIRTLQNTNWLSCLLSICLFSSWLRIK